MSGHGSVQKVLHKYNIASLLTDSGIGLQDEEETAETPPLIGDALQVELTTSSAGQQQQPNKTQSGRRKKRHNSGESAALVFSENDGHNSGSRCREHHNETDDGEHVQASSARALATATARAASEEEPRGRGGVEEATPPKAPGLRVNTLETRGGFKRPPPARVHKRARGEPPGATESRGADTSHHQSSSPLDGFAQTLRQEEEEEEQKQNQQKQQQHRHLSAPPLSVQQQRQQQEHVIGALTRVSGNVSSSRGGCLNSPDHSAGSLVELPPHPRSDYLHAGTITELNNNSCAEVELVSLIEEHIPRYKLRADTITGFVGYENADWGVISAPLLPPDEPLDLPSELIEETLNYFILCAERLTQMTRTYDDADALTRLLEEKERDLELAAHIGKSLLDEKKTLQERIEALEQELQATQELVTQLRHDLSLKSGLLAIYQEGEDDSPTGEAPPTGVELLQKKISELESENERLKNESATWTEDLEAEEERETELIHECVRELNESNREAARLQDELAKKAENSIKQQEEITQLLGQLVDLQKKVREYSIENESLRMNVDVMGETQQELTLELSEFKDKYNSVLCAFKELQEEFRHRKQRSSVGSACGPLIQGHLNNNSNSHHQHHHHHHHHQQQQQQHVQYNNQSVYNNNNSNNSNNSNGSVGLSTYARNYAQAGTHGSYTKYINPDSLAAELSMSMRTDYSEGYQSDERAPTSNSSTRPPSRRPGQPSQSVGPVVATATTAGASSTSSCSGQIEQSDQLSLRRRGGNGGGSAGGEGGLGGAGAGGRRPLSGDFDGISDEAESLFPESCQTDDDSQYSSLSSIGLNPVHGKHPMGLDVLSPMKGCPAGMAMGLPHSPTYFELDDDPTSRCRTPDSIISGFNGFSSSSTTSSMRRYRMPDKLQIIKPLEGSQTLHRWRRLATPAPLGIVGLEQRPEGVKTRYAPGSPPTLVSSSASPSSGLTTLSTASASATSGSEANNNSHGQRTQRSLSPPSSLDIASFLREIAAADDNDNNESLSQPGKRFDQSSCTYTYSTSNILHPDASASAAPGTGAPGSYVGGGGAHTQTTSTLEPTKMATSGHVHRSPVQATGGILSRSSYLAATSTCSVSRGLARLLNERGIHAMLPAVLRDKAHNHNKGDGDEHDSDDSVSATSTPAPSPDQSPPGTPPNEEAGRGGAVEDELDAIMPDLVRENRAKGVVLRSYRIEGSSEDANIDGTTPNRGASRRGAATASAASGNRDRSQHSRGVKRARHELDAQSLMSRLSQLVQWPFQGYSSTTDGSGNHSRSVRSSASCARTAHSTNTLTDTISSVLPITSTATLGSGASLSCTTSLRSSISSSSSSGMMACIAASSTIASAATSSAIGSRSTFAITTAAAATTTATATATITTTITATTITTTAAAITTMSTTATTTVTTASQSPAPSHRFEDIAQPWGLVQPAGVFSAGSVTTSRLHMPHTVRAPLTRSPNPLLQINTNLLGSTGGGAGAAQRAARPIGTVGSMRNMRKGALM